jgi:hypothetical protein
MTLAAVRARVIHIIREGLHLTADEAAKRTDEYIKFMKLKIEHPEAQLAPSHAVDQVWHNHILDTRSYQQLQTILMPDGGFIHHNPVLSEQPLYELRYANTLSLLTKQHSETLDADSWPIANSEYKKLNTIVARAEDRNIASGGPHLYCHKRQTIRQLIEFIKLVMGSTAAKYIIISGMSFDGAHKSTEQVSQTALWTSAVVRVTTFGSSGNESILDAHDRDSITGDNRLRYLHFQDEDAEVEVSTYSTIHTPSVT